MRLAGKLPLCPGGRPELALDDSEQSDSSQMHLGENCGAKQRCMETIHLSAWKEASPCPFVCLCWGTHCGNHLFLRLCGDVGLVCGPVSRDLIYTVLHSFL